LRIELKIILLTLLITLLSFSNSYSQNWTRCINGIFGGAYGVNYIINQDSILFASPSTMGVYKSSDNGINWYVSNNGLGLSDINSFYVNGTELYACTYQGLYLSTNYGQNWFPKGFNTGYTSVSGIIRSGTNLVVGLGNQTPTICYSSNNGVNWINSTGYSPYAGATNFISIDSTLFFSSKNYGIFASTDNGVTWQARNNGITYLPIYGFSFFNGALYAGGEGGVYRTYNNGINWNKCDSGFISGYNYIYSFAIHNGLLFAGTQLRGVYKSTNGSSWLPARTGIETSEITSLLSFNSTLFSTSNYGIYGVFSTINNGQNWYSSGFESYKVNSIINDNNTIFIGTDVRGIYSSTDYGNTWYPSNVDMKNKNILSMIKQSNIFAGTRDSGVYKSTNNGQNWVKSNSGLSNNSINSLYTKDSILYCGTNSGAYKTTNSGQSWNLIGLQNTPVNTFYVFNNYYCLGTNNGIRISSDGGANWASNLTSDTVYSLYSFSGKLLAGTNHGVKVSSNDGINWVSIGLNNYRINTFTNMDDTLVTSTNIGVIATTNMGNNWINLGPKQQTSGLMIYNNKIYAGGVNCVWKRDATTYTGIVSISSEVPENYYLHQNYPNPFNPGTKIKFEIPTNTYTKLTIFDITGREVKILVDEMLQPGTYETNWIADNLSSGIYFYKLTTHNFSKTKKMLLLK